MKKTLLMIFLISIISSYKGISQTQRYRLNAEIHREIISEGKERELAFNLWSDRVNTLEVQPSNMILSIDKNVFVFKVISKKAFNGGKIKYIVQIPGSPNTSEIWQITNSNRTEFEVYKSDSYYVRYLCSKI